MEPRNGVLIQDMAAGYSSDSASRPESQWAVEGTIQALERKMKVYKRTCRMNIETITGKLSSPFEIDSMRGTVKPIVGIECRKRDNIAPNDEIERTKQHLDGQCHCHNVGVFIMPVGELDE